SGGKVTTLYGGVPVIVDGQVIGAVGIGGGSGEQDAEASRAGVQAFTEQLEKPPPAPRENQPQPGGGTDPPPRPPGHPPGRGRPNEQRRPGRQGLISQPVHRPSAPRR